MAAVAATPVAAEAPRQLKRRQYPNPERFPAQWFYLQALDEIYFLRDEGTGPITNRAVAVHTVCHTLGWAILEKGTVGSFKELPDHPSVKYQLERTSGVFGGKILDAIKVCITHART